MNLTTSADWLHQDLPDGTRQSILDCGTAPGPIGVTAIYEPSFCDLASPDVMTVTTQHSGRIHCYALVYVDTFEVDPVQLRQLAAEHFQVRPTAPPG
ncbi:hypothetical protein [Streptomonospora salina]|uniref:Uncharacterized protein n=1 Tax=Streptomonospora salina TaxID=104205 RepID=A0A841EII3_9ACTN|nr:hypothetical protein [Streptomonospora salina]MBB6000853.1 hypothetical protein [Streptomonospora salina]